MANYCQNCSAAVQPGAKFCMQCGAPIVDAPAREAAPIVETPAREVAPVSQSAPIAPQERGETPQAGQYVYSPEIPAGKGAKQAVRQAAKQADGDTWTVESRGGVGRRRQPRARRHQRQPVYRGGRQHPVDGRQQRRAGIL